MAAKYEEYYVQLINARTGSPIDDDSGVYNVLTASTPAEATIYSNDQGTAGSNPGTMTDGIIQFWTASSVTTVDVTILTSTGYSVFVEGLTPSQHRVEVDLEKRTNQTLILPVVFSTASLTVVDSGFDLIAGMCVKDCYLHVTTASSGSTLTVGVSGTTDNFLLLASATATGWKFYETPIETSATAGGDYISGTQIRGTGLVLFDAGLLTACAGGANGHWALKKYYVSAATSIVYANGTTNTLASGGCYIYLDYDLLPTQGN